MRPRPLHIIILSELLGNSLSTAGNSMTSCERPPLLRKEGSPALLRGREFWNSLEASNALNYRALGIPAVLSRGIPGKALRALPGSFRNFLRKIPAVLGVWPVKVEIWGGDERRKFQFSESSGSLNGRNLFTELPSL